MESLNKDDKYKLLSLFNNIEHTSPSTIRPEILIVDGLNTYCRSFASIPSMNENGSHVGGVTGFLKSIGYAIKILNPKRCILVFDGNGGSQKRRKIYPEYKSGRKNKIRLNRIYEDQSSSEIESEGFKNQLMRLIKYIDILPVTTIAIDNIEADDTISEIISNSFKDHNISIMSTDKDFLQLVNDNIRVWSPTKKKLYGCAEILLEYGISCENFLWYRVLNGDESDNIDGVKGAGLKTILKCFPFLSENKRYSIDEIYNYATNHAGKLKLYTSVLENKDVIERNYKLMQLLDPDIQPNTKMKIGNLLNSPVQKLNRMGFSKLITEDNAWNNIPNYQTWLSECFSKLDYAS